MNIKKINLFLGLLFVIFSGFVLFKNFNIKTPFPLDFINYITSIPMIIFFPLAMIYTIGKIKDSLILLMLIGSFIITLIFYLLLSVNNLNINILFIIFSSECFGISLGVIIKYLFFSKPADGNDV